MFILTGVSLSIPMRARKNIKKQSKKIAGDHMTEVKCRNSLCKYHTGDDYCSLDKIYLGWKGQLYEFISKENEKVLVCANYKRRNEI